MFLGVFLAGELGYCKPLQRNNDEAVCQVVTTLIYRKSSLLQSLTTLKELQQLDEQRKTHQHAQQSEFIEKRKQLAAELMKDLLDEKRPHIPTQQNKPATSARTASVNIVLFCKGHLFTVSDCDTDRN